MAKCILLVGLTIVIPTVGLAQVEQWVARYNGPGDSTDVACALTLDNAGNTYVTGYSWGSGTDYDYATVKYNASGVEQWVARYNGPGDSTDVAYALTLDNAGNTYVTGYSWGSGTDYDYATVKYNASGVEQWVARYNGSENDDDRAYAIAFDNANNVYITGRSYGGDIYSDGTHYDYATVKYNASGVEQWVERYDGPAGGNDQAYAIAIDNVNNVYVTGMGDAIFWAVDYATVKYDSSGEEQWVAEYNGPGNHWDVARGLILDNAGNICVTGYSGGSGGTFEDYATVKYNSSGEEQWVARYNGTGNSEDFANAITVDDAGNVYVTGESFGLGTDDDYATVKYDPSGVEQWTVRYHGPGDGYDYAYAIAVDDSGNVYVTGRSWGAGSARDYATVKYDVSGAEVWVARYNGPVNDNDWALGIAVDNEAHVYVTGLSMGSGTDYDYTTIKYFSTVSVEEKTTSIESSYSGATLFSGPLQLPTAKECRVFDITGRVIAPDKIRPGVYFVEIDGQIVRKVIKIR